jgi:hypothetical protein
MFINIYIFPGNNLDVLVNANEVTNIRNITFNKEEGDSFIFFIMIIIISALRRPLLNIDLPQSSPRRSVLRCPHPVASRDHVFFTILIIDRIHESLF